MHEVNYESGCARLASFSKLGKIHVLFQHLHWKFHAQFSKYMWNVSCSLTSNLTKQMAGGVREKQLRLANKPGINILNPE